MLYVIFGVVCLTIVSIFLILEGNKSFEWWDWIAVCAGWIGMIVSIIAVICCIMMGFQWKGSEVKANLINREYGTDYTQEEIFYASSTINIIRELDRKRIEINGDIRRQRDPQRDLPARPDNR